MKDDRERKFGREFVLEKPDSADRESQLIVTKKLIAERIQPRLNALGHGQKYTQFKVEAGKVGQKPTLLISAPVWAQELGLEDHLVNMQRRLNSINLRGWSTKFEYRIDSGF